MNALNALAVGFALGLGVASSVMVLMFFGRLSNAKWTDGTGGGS